MTGIRLYVALLSLIDVVLAIISLEVFTLCMIVITVKKSAFASQGEKWMEDSRIHKAYLLE